MKMILNLMRVDLISMLSKNGGRFKSIVTTLIISIALCLLGIFVMPDFLAFYVILLSFLIVPRIIGQENKSESARLLCVIPMDRKNIVLARFTLAVSILTAVSLILYLLLRLSPALGIMNESATWMMVEIFLDYSGMNISVSGFANVLFFTCYMIGLMILSHKLRGYFKYGAINKRNSLIRKVLKGILIYLLCMAIGSVVIYLFTIPLIQTVFSIFFSLFLILSIPVNGLLLCLTLFVTGCGTVVYQAVCSMIEYEEREL